jgi:tryptophan halogenase
MKRIAVIGVGTAGLLTVSHLLSWLVDWEVVSIYDPNISILGIGESTNPSFVSNLQVGIDFNLYDCLTNHDLDSTQKMGTMYVDWRPHQFINPLLGGTLALHIDTFKVKDYIIPKLYKKWGYRFTTLEGRVQTMCSNTDSVIVKINDNEYQFDYVVDCSGFPNDFSNYTIIDGFVDSCLVYDSSHLTNWNYTLHQATPNGWMFGVPLFSRTSYGYLYNKSLTSIDIATNDFAKLMSVSLDKFDTKSYKFSSYYANKFISNRIIKNGNKSAFFEPMFANSLWIYDYNNRLIIDYLISGHDIELVNQRFRHRCQTTYEMICYHYHGGSIHNSKFWKFAEDSATHTLEHSKNFHHLVGQMQDMNLRKYHIETPHWGYGTTPMRLIDRNLGYGYFEEA